MPEKKEIKYIIGEIPTQTDFVITTKEGDEQYNILTAVAKMMNDIEEIRDVIVGKK